MGEGMPWVVAAPGSTYNMPPARIRKQRWLGRFQPAAATAATTVAPSGPKSNIAFLGQRSFTRPSAKERMERWVTMAQFEGGPEVKGEGGPPMSSQDLTNAVLSFFGKPSK